MALALLVTGCNADPASPLHPSGPSRLTLAVESGTNQTGRADRPLPLPLQVRVRRNGHLAAGASVQWHTTDGTIVPSGTTDAEGLATAVWTLPRRGGRARASATVEGGAESAVFFYAESRLPELRMAGGNGQVMVAGETLAEPLRVQATWDGQPLVGEEIRWSFLAAPILTGPDGIASVSWPVSSLAGTRFAVAQFDRLSDPAVGFTATVLAAPVSSLTMDQSIAVPYWTHGGELGFAVTARDPYGNIVADVPITWSLDIGPEVEPQVSVTGPDGVARWRYLPPETHGGDIRARTTTGGIEAVSPTFRYAEFIWIDPTGWGDYPSASSATIQPGATVRWVNDAYYEHVVGPAGGTGAGALVYRGAVYEQTFPTAGVHEWVCILHEWERFTIVVAP